MTPRASLEPLVVLFVTLTMTNNRLLILLFVICVPQGTRPMGLGLGGSHRPQPLRGVLGLFWTLCAVQNGALGPPWQGPLEHPGGPHFGALFRPQNRPPPGVPL